MIRGASMLCLALRNLAAPFTLKPQRMQLNKTQKKKTNTNGEPDCHGRDFMFEAWVVLVLTYGG